MKIRRVFRYDSSLKMIRICRLIWTRGKGPAVGYPDNYDAMLSLAIRPALFAIKREEEGWFVTVCGLRVHYRRSYGGVIV
jgi:hypothetical protein